MDAGIGVGGLSLGKDEVLSSAFDLFSPVEVENSISKSHVQIFHPISATASKGPFKFIIPPDPEKFTDAQSLRLMGRVKIQKKGNTGVLTDFVAGDKVSVVNSFYHSLWSAVNIKLNGADITDPTGNWYPYKAHIESLLSYSSASKNSVLASRGFYPDTTGEFDTIDVANEGFKARGALFSTSEWNYFCINIHADVTTLRRVLPPNIQIDVECKRNSDEFTILTAQPGGTAEILLSDLKLKVNRYSPSPKIKAFYNQKISKGLKPILPIDRSLIKAYTIQPGTSNLSAFNLIVGQQLPDQVLIGIVSESAYTGDYTKNPFNFKHLNLKEASLVVNGTHEPEQKYQMNHAERDVADIYQDFLENTGISIDDRENGIDINSYFGGNFILAFDRTKDKCNRYHRHVTDSGAIDINLKTHANITETVTVIVYATYTSDLIIEEGNKVVHAIF